MRRDLVDLRACLARVATARRRPATGRPRHRRPARQLPCRRCARPTARRSCRLLMLLRAAGPSRTDAAAPRRSCRRRAGPARLRVAGGEGLLRVRSVQVARRPRQVHARQRVVGSSSPTSAGTACPSPTTSSTPARASRPGSSADASPAPARSARARDASHTHTMCGGTDASSGQRCLPARRARRAWRAIARSIRRSSSSEYRRRSLPTASGTSRSG